MMYQVKIFCKYNSIITFDITCLLINILPSILKLLLYFILRNLLLFYHLHLQKPFCSFFYFCFYKNREQFTMITGFDFLVLYIYTRTMRLHTFFHSLFSCLQNSMKRSPPRLSFFFSLM